MSGIRLPIFRTWRRRLLPKSWVKPLPALKVVRTVAIFGNNKMKSNRLSFHGTSADWSLTETEMPKIHCPLEIVLVKNVTVFWRPRNVIHVQTRTNTESQFKLTRRRILAQRCWWWAYLTCSCSRSHIRLHRWTSTISRNYHACAFVLVYILIHHYNLGKSRFLVLFLCFFFFVSPSQFHSISRCVAARWRCQRRRLRQRRRRRATVIR